jgi:hypothetical protein
LVGVAIKTGLVFGWGGIGNGLVGAVEQVAQADPSFINVLFKPGGNLSGSFLGQVVDALMVIIQTYLSQALTDGFGLRMWSADCARWRV